MSEPHSHEFYTDQCTGTVYVLGINGKWAVYAQPPPSAGKVSYSYIFHVLQQF